MAIVRKFTLGVLPFAKTFRIHGLGGAAVDAVLRLRGKTLPESYFADVGVNADRTAYRVSSEDHHNSLQLTEENLTLTKDYYEGQQSFDFRKVLEEFRLIWTAVDSVLKITDIRRIGMVAEHRYSVENDKPGLWMRTNLSTVPTSLATDKFMLRYEEREFASDGGVPDLKKADFINYIYTIYDSSSDVNHPRRGFVDADVDVQRYFAPLFSGNVGDEVLKLHKHLDPAVRRIDDFLKSRGAAHAKR
jgi:hypothetical protein